MRRKAETLATVAAKLRDASLALVEAEGMMHDVKYLPGLAAAAADVNTLRLQVQLLRQAERHEAEGAEG